MTRFYIYGSDARWDQLALFLAEKGEVLREGAPREKGDVLIFPFNIKEEEVLERILSAPEGTRLFLWRVTDAERSLAEKKGDALYALGEDRILRAQNALATAEGCLASVLSSRDRTLFGETVLVCGFGHCGSAIARLFWLCGCEVYVYSRAHGRQLAEAEGFNTLSTLHTRRAAMFSLVLNTVPAPIFPEEVLRQFSSGTDLYQIASGDSGVDEAFCREKGIRVIPLPALPARFSPRSEAELLEEIILEQCGEVAPWQ